MSNIENLRDLIIYQSQNNENISVEVLYDEEDFWLTQKLMAELFNVAENNITYHLKNIFKTQELEENRTTQKIRVVQAEGNRKVSRKQAEEKAEKEYNEFNKTQKIVSDFDKLLLEAKRIEGNK